MKNQTNDVEIMFASFMVTILILVVQVDVLETILQSVPEAKTDPEPSQEEVTASVPKPKQTESEETSEESEWPRVPEYLTQFKVRGFFLTALLSCSRFLLYAVASK